MNKVKSKIIWIIAYAVLLIPFIYSILLSMPAADDFSFAITSGNVLIEAMKKTGEFYLTWGGRWLTYFYFHAFNTLAYFGPTSRAYGVFLLICFFVFIYALYYSIGVILKKCWKFNDVEVDVIRFIMISAFIITIHFREVYYWFSGSWYALWQAALLVCVASMIRFFIGKEEKAYMPMIIFGVIATTGEMWCVPTGLFYLWLLLRFYDKNRGALKQVVPLVLYIISGAIEVFAPGNFVRSASGTQSGGLSNAIPALSWAVKIFAHHTIKLLKQPVFLIILLCAIIVGIFFVTKEKRKGLLETIIIGGLSLLFMVYPVVLGYGGPTYLPNRTEFVFMNTLILLVILIVVLVANQLATRLNLKASKKMGGIILCFIAVITVLLGFKIGPSFSTWTNIVANTAEIKKESDYGFDLIEQIQSSEEDDVVVDEIFYTYTGILDNFLVADDPEHWVNQGVAKYLGKNSIKANYLDEGHYDAYE